MHCPGNVRRKEMSCTLLQTPCTSFSRKAAFPREGPARCSQRWFYQLKNLSGRSHVGAVSLVPWTFTAEAGCFQFNKQIKGCLLKKLATYLAAKNTLSTEARRYSRCSLYFYFIPGKFTILLLQVRVPFKIFPLQLIFLVAIFAIDAMCNHRWVTLFTCIPFVQRGQ